MFCRGWLNGLDEAQHTDNRSDWGMQRFIETAQSIPRKMIIENVTFLRLELPHRNITTDSLIARRQVYRATREGDHDQQFFLDTSFVRC